MVSGAGGAAVRYVVVGRPDRGQLHAGAGLCLASGGGVVFQGAAARARDGGGGAAVHVAADASAGGRQYLFRPGHPPADRDDRQCGDPVVAGAGLVSSWLIILALGLPLFAALWIWFLGKSPNQREAITLISAVALLLVVLAILPLVLAGLPVRLELLAPVPGLSLAFAVEPLGMIFACVASFLWIVNSVFSIGYMRGNQEPRQTRFYVCFAIA
ncbi:MAG TPA: hypothetical protein EYQ03_03310, partial [Nitrospinaceae bacterium]|nr:hypothetical protein [Nitrospinaceae bacterium]